MKKTEDYLRPFENLGGKFYITIKDLKKKILELGGFIFDWDGVFHPGNKSDQHSSSFSEIDSMGTNMLRYGYWRKFGKLPVMIVISGQKDKTAFKFTEREHFDGLYTGFIDKKVAIEHASQAANLKPSQMACVFDDIIDLPMAKLCGLRLLIRRGANPLFNTYAIQHKMCDYITAHSVQENAVRECCELLLGLLGNYNETIESRVMFDKEYQDYLKIRNEKITQYFTSHDGKITSVKVKNLTNGG